jgi:hypothetical protein
LVVIAGLVFIMVTLAQNLFGVGSAFEEMIDDFRPALQDEAIAQYRADIQGLGAVAEEFQAAVVPGMAEAMDMSPQDFGAMMQGQFPAVAEGMALLPEAGPTFGDLIDTLAAQQDNFFSADEIPTESLPAQTVPWGFTIAGLIAIGIGVLMLLRPARAYLIAALVLGVLIVAGSFVLSLPAKSADADDLNAALEPVYTVETVENAKGALGVIGAMGTEMSETMMPALAEALGMDQDGLNQFMGQNFPATAQTMQTFEASMGRFNELVGIFDANLDNYDTLQPVRFVPIIWIFIIGGVVIAVAGTLGLLWRRGAETTAAA